jgi:hypothetical protein
MSPVRSASGLLHILVVDFFAKTNMCYQQCAGGIRCDSMVSEGYWDSRNLSQGSHFAVRRGDHPQHTPRLRPASSTSFGNLKATSFRGKGLVSPRRSRVITTPPIRLRRRDRHHGLGTPWMFPGAPFRRNTGETRRARIGYHEQRECRTSPCHFPSHVVMSQVHDGGNELDCRWGGPSPAP